MAEPVQPDISDQAHESFVIVGRTDAGKRFRPSDWAERLCGVMSQYGPKGRRQGHLTYSPYVMPGDREGIKCVTVDRRLYDVEPLAYRFMIRFARDNQLVLETIGHGGPARDEPGGAGAQTNLARMPLGADC